MLFHISTNPYLDSDILIPRIPESIAKCEDNTTPRICFSPSINGCLQALCKNCGEHLPNIFNVIENYNAYKNSRDNKKDIPEYIKKDYIVNYKYSEADFNYINMQFSIQNNINNIEAIAYYDYIKNGYVNGIYPFYFIYTPDEDIYAHDCEIPNIFDQEYTHEIWIKRPIKVKRIASMFVIGTNDIKNVECKLNNDINDIITQREFLYKLLPPNYNSPWIKYLEEYYSNKK